MVVSVSACTWCGPSPGIHTAWLGARIHVALAAAMRSTPWVAQSSCARVVVGGNAVLSAHGAAIGEDRAHWVQQKASGAGGAAWCLSDMFWHDGGLTQCDGLGWGGCMGKSERAMPRVGFSLKQAAVAVLVVGAQGLALLPSAGLTAVQARILAVVLVTLGMWANGVVPNYLASLILFAVVLAFGLAPADAVFSGVSCTAVWRIISGFVIGAAISASGLEVVLVRVLGPLLGDSYARMIFGLIVVAMALGFIMPLSVGLRWGWCRLAWPWRPARDLDRGRMAGLALR